MISANPGPVAMAAVGVDRVVLAGSDVVGIRYSGHTTAEAMHAQLTAAPRGATGDLGAAAVHVTPEPTS